MELLLIIATLFLSKKYFKEYSYVHELIIIKTILVVLFFLFFQYFFMNSNGIPPMYSDQLTFIRLAESGYSALPIWKTIFTTSLHSSNYGTLLSYFYELSFNIQLFAILLNNFVFIFLVKYSLNILKYLKVDFFYLKITAYLLILSPVFVLFTTLVLRDIIIATLFTQFIYYYLKKSYLKTILVIICLMILKKHLILLALITLLIIDFFKIKMFTFFVICLLAIAIHIIYLEKDIFILLELPNMIFQNLMGFFGLHFIFHDTAPYSKGNNFIFLFRFLLIDSYLPQMLLVFILIYYRKIVKIHKITFFYVMINLPYLYLYYVYGGMTYRASIMPFTALIYIQLCYYVNLIIKFKRSSYK